MYPPGETIGGASVSQGARWLLVLYQAKDGTSAMRFRCTSRVPGIDLPCICGVLTQCPVQPDGIDNAHRFDQNTRPVLTDGIKLTTSGSTRVRGGNPVMSERDLSGYGPESLSESEIRAEIDSIDALPGEAYIREQDRKRALLSELNRRLPGRNEPAVFL